MQRALRIIVGLGVVLLLVAPLLLVWPATGSHGGETPATSPPIHWLTLAKTLAVSAAAALVAVLAGGTLAIILVSSQFRGAALWATLVLIPFICPHTVWALAHVYCYGPGGVLERMCGDSLRPWLESLNQGHFLSTTLVLAQVYAPLAMLFIWPGAARLHHAGWQAAQLFLSPTRQLVWLVRTLLPEIAGAAFLVFALAAGNFAVPHVLQCRLYMIDVYMRASNYLDHAGAIYAATPLVVVSVLAVVAVVAVDERGTHGRRMASGVRHPPLGKANWLGGTLLSLYIVLTIALPIGALIIECQSTSLFLQTAREAAPEMANTIYVALMVAGLGVAAAAAVQCLPSGTASLAGRGAAFATLGVPALIIGLAYVRTFSQIGGDWIAGLRGAGAALIVALTFRIWPFATRALTSSNRLADPRWREAADLANLTALRRWKWISIPWATDYVLTAALIGFVISVGEVEISQLLCEPGQGTVVLRLFTYLHLGPTYTAAGLAVLLLIVACVPVLIYFLVVDRCLRVV